MKNKENKAQKNQTNEPFADLRAAPIEVQSAADAADAAEDRNAQHVNSRRRRRHITGLITAPCASLCTPSSQGCTVLNQICAHAAKLPKKRCQKHATKNVFCSQVNGVSPKHFKSQMLPQVKHFSTFFLDLSGTS